MTVHDRVKESFEPIVCKNCVGFLPGLITSQADLTWGVLNFLFDMCVWPEG